ncbi:universal stress protein [Arthrobacter woluwensis]|uniref:Nucleotide-binding universal stress protein, UspA family n=1 Tax=Arthrobacter woluwensis TaxID=156980 RepID=A0A1H4P641_9MICC|nr:universal stress protein [Arthrobacter woluwensis]PSS44940.1 universal stress protein [Arthrobacter woluwensis]SEC02903.1 Nucleotide-binding universal stress protein, UspA family [Arthrobacter woluwensis]
MPEIIVVGVDGTETAARAAEQALRLAQGFGATLHVVTAYEGNKASLHGANYERAVIFGDRQEKAAETARTVAGSLSADGVQVEAFSVVGTPAEALIAHAEEHDASVIVVGNRRMKGLARVLGSVANSVAHEAKCNVYIADTTD